MKGSQQGEEIIKAIASLHAQISAQEVELGSLRLSATEENPEVQNLPLTLPSSVLEQAWREA